MSAAALSLWLDSIGSPAGLQSCWQSSLRGRPDEWTRVLSALQTIPLTLSAYRSIAQYASADLASAARDCDASLRYFNGLYGRGDGQTLEWLNARKRYELSVAQFRVAGERHRLDVVAAIDAWKRGESPRIGQDRPARRHRACSELVSRRISWLCDELRRRQRDGGIAQPAAMAQAIRGLGLTSAFYIASIENLGSICSLGILPHSLAPTVRADISNQEIQSRRSAIRVPIRGTDLSLHDFTPMFFVAKTPMLWERSDPRTGIGKDRLCIVECAVDDVAKWCAHLSVTDRNAAVHGAELTSDPAKASIIPRDVILRGKWMDLPDGRARRSAELLCYPLVPAPAIAAVHVCSRSVASLVRERLHAARSPVPVVVSAEYFPAW